jgi:hypothetical protein
VVHKKSQTPGNAVIFMKTYCMTAKDDMDAFSDGVEELQKILALGRQQWLMGAGVSFAANIPLMYPLTTRVKACLAQAEAALLAEIMSDMPATAHVEHALSQLGDLIAIAERPKRVTRKSQTVL